MKQLRDKIFSIRLTQHELEYIQCKADECGISAGAYIRLLVKNDKEVQNNENDRLQMR